MPSIFFYVEIPCYIFSLIHCSLTYIITTAPPLNLPLPSLPLAALLKNSLNTFLAFRLFMTYFKNSSCHFDFATLILLFFSLSGHFMLLSSKGSYFVGLPLPISFTQKFCNGLSLSYLFSLASAA